MTELISLNKIIIDAIVQMPEKQTSNIIILADNCRQHFSDFLDKHRDLIVDYRDIDVQDIKVGNSCHIGFYNHKNLNIDIDFYHIAETDLIFNKNCHVIISKEYENILLRTNFNQLDNCKTITIMDKQGNIDPTAIGFGMNATSHALMRKANFRGDVCVQNIAEWLYPYFYSKEEEKYDNLEIQNAMSDLGLGYGLLI